MPDVISYNAAIAACANARPAAECDYALELLDVMRRSVGRGTGEGGAAREGASFADAEVKVAPDVISYNTAIAACARVIPARWEQALALLKEMSHAPPEAACAPDVVSYNAAIAACEKGAEWERAIELLSAMWGAGLEPDRISYNAAISACARAGRWESALELLGEMREIGPDAISYSAAISACARAAQVRQGLGSASSDTSSVGCVTVFCLLLLASSRFVVV